MRAQGLVVDVVGVAAGCTGVAPVLGVAVPAAVPDVGDGTRAGA